ncbi:exocyst complex component 5 [Striga asiatica]|uniref:Exocyst complex component 5 n=1 Tax=Striga asiatica TaxID=4170 RepID=A0A5A7PCZ1_STRAF|nr:exocyst complex component 5 [Striga asiatica]
MNSSLRTLLIMKFSSSAGPSSLKPLAVRSRSSQFKLDFPVETERNIVGEIISALQNKIAVEINLIIIEPFWLLQKQEIVALHPITANLAKRTEVKNPKDDRRVDGAAHARFCNNKSLPEKRRRLVKSLPMLTSKDCRYFVWLNDELQNTLTSEKIILEEQLSSKEALEELLKQKIAKKATKIKALRAKNAEQEMVISSLHEKTNN